MRNIYKPIFLCFLVFVLFLFTGCVPSEVEYSSQDEVIDQEEVEVSEAPIATITQTPKPTFIPQITNTEKLDFYEVVRVVDGDTIWVSKDNKQEKVRLIGVDTPETVDPRKGIQCFGKEASAFLTNLILNKNVRMEGDNTQQNSDAYGRLLRYVYTENGFLVNKEIIEKGYGYEYTYKIPYVYQTEFKKAQQYASQNKLGLWADSACVSAVPVPQARTEGIGNFVCNCSKVCSNMASCDEAYFQLNNCGCKQRDGDGDGIPCESICR